MSVSLPHARKPELKGIGKEKKKENEKTPSFGPLHRAEADAGPTGTRTAAVVGRTG